MNPHPLAPYLATIFGENPWTLVDVGAYRGDFTAQLLQSGANPAKCIVCEGSPELFRQAQENLGSNASIELRKICVDEKSGRAPYFLDTNPSFPVQECHRLPRLNSPADAPRVEVATLGLSDLLQEIAGPVFLKTSLHGFDLHVLRSAKAVLDQRVPVVVVQGIFADIFYQDQSSALEVWALMRELDYELFQMSDLYSLKPARLAYANLIFVKKSLIASCQELETPTQFIANDSLRPIPVDHYKEIADSYKESAASYKEAADARLALIAELHETAANRQALIECLDKTLQNLSTLSVEKSSTK